MITATNVIGSILVFVLGGIFMQIRVNNNKLKDALYRNGLPIYVPKVECDKTHATICNKVEEIKKIVTKADDKRQEARKEDSANREAIQHTLGRVEEYMKAHK